MFRTDKREWRNRQTRTFEGRVVIPYGFKSRLSHQKSTGFDLSIFYPLRKQWYIITRKRASHHRRCISSAAGCISFRNDDIQNFVLMICNSCGIDDIHGFRRDLCKSSNSYSIMPKISFSQPIDKNRLAKQVYFFIHCESNGISSRVSVHLSAA